MSEETGRERLGQEKSTSKRIAASLSAFLSIGGMYYLIVEPARFLWEYFTFPNNPSRHEYLQGVVLSCYTSAAFWLPVSFLLLYARKVVPRRLLIAGLLPAILLCFLFLAMNGVVLMGFFMGRL